MRKVTLAWMVVALMAIGAAGRGQGMSDENKKENIPLLTVNGRGEVMARPDRAVVRLGVTVQSEKAAAAQQQVNQVMQQALDAIKRLDVPAERISTVGLNLSPVYSSVNPQMASGRGEAPRIVGYRANNVIQVIIDKLEQIGPVVDAGVASGANEVQGIAFDLKDDLAARQEALKQAVAEARAKADTIAGALAVQISGPHEVNEGGVNVIRPMMQERMMLARAADTAGTPVEPGQVRIEANVTIRYRIERKPLPPPASPAPAQ